MAAIQWSNSELTMKNPMGNPTPSIISLNSSASGYPELSYFYNSKFMEDHKQDPDIDNYKGIQFGLNWTLNILKHNSENISDYVKDWDTILHVGNLQYIF